MRIEWDKSGERFYETGVEHGVMYTQDAKGAYPKGVAWNGITGVTEKPGGAESTDLWADNIKYASLRSAETFSMTLEAYTYPKEFKECDGSVELYPGVYAGQQNRTPFGFSYKTDVGNDTATTADDSYKLHLIYGLTASPSERGYQTRNDSPEAITFSWECESTPVNFPTASKVKAVSSIEISSADVPQYNMELLEDALYGTDVKEAHLPLPEELIEILTAVAPEPEAPVQLNVIAATGKLEDSTVDYKKNADAIQENIVIDSALKKISGNLKNIESPWTEFAGSDNTGHFLALNVTNVGTDTQYPIYVEVKGGTAGKKQMDASGLVICRITSNSSQSIEFTCNDVTETYTLNDLTLGG